VYEAKLSGKNQIVIPREARIALNIKAGDRVLVVVRNGTVILLPKPKRYSKSLRGIARGLYPPDYLGRERESW
jgi:AbrB family looped-hinge helix DNA binding protein